MLALARLGMAFITSCPKAELNTTLTYLAHPLTKIPPSFYIFTQLFVYLLL